MTVTRTTLYSVTVDAALGGGEELTGGAVTAARVAEGLAVTVTTCVLTTTETDVDTTIETGEGGADTGEMDALGPAEGLVDVALADGDEVGDAWVIPVDVGMAELGVEDIAEEDGTLVGAGTAAALKGTGVGMTVELGLGGGMPFGYEFWKMSSCEPSLKL